MTNAQMQAVLVPFALWFASGLLNLLLWKRTPEQWEAFVASNPTGAVITKGLRKFGFDLPGLIRLAALYLRARGAATLPEPPEPPRESVVIRFPAPAGDSPVSSAEPSPGELSREGEGAEG